MSGISDEGKRQLLGLLFSIATVAIVGVVARISEEPDLIRTQKMRVYSGVCKWSNRQALHFLDIADRAADLYDQERL